MSTAIEQTSVSSLSGDGMGANVKAVPCSGSAEFQRYYEEAGPDYEAWSPRFNMHFGYAKAGCNPFDREAMLEEMNREVLRRLRVEGVPSPRLLDMGCGLSATLRSIARQVPGAELTGVTLVPWQRERGTELNGSGADATEVSARIRLLLADYQSTGLSAASMDGVYALESSCYAHGADKAALLREAHRLLRPGGRLVVADGFLLRAGGLHGPQAALYRRLCRCWAIETLGELPAFVRQLEQLGFRDIEVEHAQMRVAPSVLHVPWVTVRFLAAKLLRRGGSMTRARWNNLLAPLLLPWVSQPLGPVGYCIVSATR